MAPEKGLEGGVAREVATVQERGSTLGAGDEEIDVVVAEVAQLDAGS